MTNENCLEGIRCPGCGNEERLFITATIRADVTDDGAEPADGCGMHWDDASLAICPECDRDGPLGEFRTPPDLPPDPEGMNDRRAGWAGIALAAFRDATGADEEDAPGDLIANLMHWSDRHNFDFEAALDRARFHYDAETSACQAADSVACFPTDNEGDTMTGTHPVAARRPGSPAPGDLRKVRVSLEGLDGNALSLIGAWRNAARDQGWPEAGIEAVLDLPRQITQ